MTPEIFKHIRRIQIYTDRLAKDLLAGMYRSAFKGRGMEFEEVREYQLGDEVRNIDWNVTARMNHPYVKKFREEREITVTLIVDVSASGRFGARNTLKSELIAEIGALIAFSAIKNNDKLGLILFSDRVEKYIPPNKSERHILRLIRELLLYRPVNQGTNVSEALHYLGTVQNKTGICFLISDFICEDYSHEALLTTKHHDLIAISVTDPYEIEFPSMNLVELQDLETGLNAIIDTSNPQVLKHFREIAENRIVKNEKLLRRIGAGFINIRTDVPYMPALQKFFRLRSEQRR